MRKEQSLVYKEGMESISSRLDAMQCMLDSIILGMTAEKIEVQAISCIECIKFCMHDLQTYANELILQTDKMKMEE